MNTSLKAGHVESQELEAEKAALGMKKGEKGREYIYNVEGLHEK